MGLPKVLIVDDNEELQECWQALLRRTVIVVSAYSLDEASELFQSNPDIALIAMDGCVPGDVLNTIPLVEEFKKTFKGPMVAISANDSFRVRLLDAGCNYECTKQRVPHTIKSLLEQ